MESKKYFNKQSSMRGFSICLSAMFFAIEVYLISLLFDSFALLRAINEGVIGDLMYDFDCIDDPETFVGILIFLVACLIFFFLRQSYILRKTPILEIHSNSIEIRLTTNYTSNHIRIKYDDIENIKLSEFKFLGRHVQYIDIIPQATSYDKIISCCKKQNRRIIENLYKKWGIIARIGNLEQPIVYVYDDIMESYNKYKEENNK